MRGAVVAAVGPSLLALFFSKNLFFPLLCSDDAALSRVTTVRMCEHAGGGRASVPVGLATIFFKKSLFFPPLALPRRVCGLKSSAVYQWRLDHRCAVALCDFSRSHFERALFLPFFLRPLFFLSLQTSSDFYRYVRFDK